VNLVQSLSSRQFRFRSTIAGALTLSLGAVFGTQSSSIAATRTTVVKKPAIPQAGKPCSKSQVGTPVAGPNGLLDCVKQGSKYVWKVSAASPTTVAAAAATTVAATTEKWPDKLIFAPVPAENAAASLVTWGPLVKSLEKELGIKIEQVATSDYAGVIEGQLSNKIDLAMYGPFSYYLARQSGAKIEPVAVTVRDIGLPPSYQSYLVTRANSPINSIGDVRGRKVCFVDNASTSGYLYPFAGLKEAGINPESDISAVFAGGHDRSVTAVKAGTCDAGFAFDDMVNITAVERGLIRSDEIKVVWRSKAIPNSPLAMSTNLPPSLKAKIKQVLPKLDSLYFKNNGFCPETGACNLGGSNAWVPVNEAFFQPIADVCKETNAPACQPAKK
jgi:phosphonate transport system substrate-binding protein